jgi:hypothetical protein
MGKDYELAVYARSVRLGQTDLLVPASTLVPRGRRMGRTGQTEPSTLVSPESFLQLSPRQPFRSSCL